MWGGRKRSFHLASWYTYADVVIVQHWIPLLCTICSSECMCYPTTSHPTQTDKRKLSVTIIYFSGLLLSLKKNKTKWTHMPCLAIHFWGLEMLFSLLIVLTKKMYCDKFKLELHASEWVFIFWRWQISSGPLSMTFGKWREGETTQHNGKILLFLTKKGVNCQELLMIW